MPDYDQNPNLIVSDNLSGHAMSRGVAMSLNQNFGFDRHLYSVHNLRGAWRLGVGTELHPSVKNLFGNVQSSDALDTAYV